MDDLHRQDRPPITATLQEGRAIRMRIRVETPRSFS
jgi:hypothetical protein